MDRLGDGVDQVTAQRRRVGCNTAFRDILEMNRRISRYTLELGHDLGPRMPWKYAAVDVSSHTLRQGIEGMSAAHHCGNTRCPNLSNRSRIRPQSCDRLRIRRITSKRAHHCGRLGSLIAGRGLEILSGQIAEL